MPINRTDKYRLSQWESSDRVLMEDFNTDNLNLENALAGLEASKAAAADLTALTAEVAAKAASSTLTDLQNAVAAKADRSELAGLQNVVAAKAEWSDLAALQNTVNQLSAALTALQSATPRVKVGTFQGDNTQNRFIDVGFTPSAVLLGDNYGTMFYYNGTRNAYRGGLTVTGGPLTTHVYNNTFLKVLEITTNGFIVTSDSFHTGSTTVTVDSNNSNLSYRYIAIG